MPHRIKGSGSFGTSRSFEIARLGKDQSTQNLELSGKNAHRSRRFTICTAQRNVSPLNNQPQTSKKTKVTGKPSAALLVLFEPQFIKQSKQLVDGRLIRLGTGVPHFSAGHQPAAFHDFFAQTDQKALGKL